ncbi:MAG: site-specific integrase [Comamonas sp.]
MASIINRGPFQYQAIIRRRGYPSVTKTFESKRDAEDWTKVTEAEMVRGVFVSRTEAERTTLGELLERYLAEMTPTKKGWREEKSRIQRFMKHPLALRMLAALRAVDFSKYRDERLKEVKPKTVQLELATLSAVFTFAAKDWSIPIDNPILHISKPRLPKGRERRLLPDEEDRLLAAARQSKTPYLVACIQLAIETGMRRGEIASLTWSQFDFRTKTIRLTDTKNGDDRIVPLSIAAEAVIHAMPRQIHTQALTDFHDSNGVGAAFRRACKRAGLNNLTFHDLRHEAASRLAKKVPVATLAKIMGWKTLQMAMRYYNPTAVELVEAVRAAA